MGLAGQAVLEFLDAEQKITDAELGVDQPEVAFDHFRPVMRDIEHCLDLYIFAFDVELFENFEPEQMRNCDAYGFFQGIGGIDYELLVNGLDEFGNSLLDFRRDDFEINAIGRPEGEVLGARLEGKVFSRFRHTKSV